MPTGRILYSTVMCDVSYIYIIIQIPRHRTSMIQVGRKTRCTVDLLDLVVETTDGRIVMVDVNIQNSANKKSFFLFSFHLQISDLTLNSVYKFVPVTRTFDVVLEYQIQ